MKTNGSMKVTDNMLTGTGEVDLQQLVMKQLAPVDTSAIAQALQTLTSLNMTMLLDGTLSDPGFNIKSDLDNKLQSGPHSLLPAKKTSWMN